MLSWKFYFSGTGSVSQSILPLCTNSQGCSAWQLTAHSLELQSSQETLKVCRLLGAGMWSQDFLGFVSAPVHRGHSSSASPALLLVKREASL